MKIYLISISLLIFSIVNHITIGQNVYTDPEFPGADEPVTLYFDATGSPLENTNQDVYTHTGLTINGNQWQHVIGEWGVNEQQPKLTEIESNLYTLELTPSIRDFYGASSSAEISELCMVFRSADAGTQTSNLFLPVFASGLEIVLLYPPLEEDLIVIEGDSNLVSVVSPLADSLYLYLNDEVIAAVEDIYLNEIVVAQVVNEYWEYQWIKIKAVNETEMVVDSFSFQLIQTPPVVELPIGMKDGINYLSDQSVLLSLYAPGIKFVFATGEFNNWELSDESYMNITPDEERFWIQVDNLVPGQEYAFHYEIEYTSYIGDPYCEKVLDPWNDQYINNATYPNLKPYPLSPNQGIVSVLQTNQEEYNWQNTDFTPPEVTDLVIYELLIRDFTPQHTFLSLIDTLDYLKRLGINAIELMPINEFEGNLSWGYNPNYYFAVDKYYGPKNTLKQFVDACHDEGIAVILDVVYNHSFGTSPYVLMHWDQNTNAPQEDSPFYNVVPKHDYNVGFDMNHESQATKQYISRALKFWLEEFKIDGYRFDLSKGFTQTNTLGNVNQWGQYDQSRIDILAAYADSVWSVNENAYVILEHFADNSEEKVLSNDYNMMIWGNMNHNYTEASMGWTSTSNLNWASYQARGWDDPNLVVYMESHDEERMMYKNITWGNSDNSDHNVKDTTIALERVPLAAAFHFGIPGPKMIWQFGELGYDYSIDYNGRTGEKPIRWDYYDDYRRKLVYDLFAAMIKLKTDYPTFKTTNYNLDVGGELKQISLNHTEMNATIIGNFATEQNTMDVSFQTSGIWYDYFSGDSIDIPSANHEIDLAPGEFRIYTDIKLETPEIGLGIFDNPNEKINVSTIYPNPSNDLFNISFNLSARSFIEVNIYNLNGQKVRSVYAGELGSGNNSIVWDGLNNAGVKVNKGMFLSELIIDGQKDIKKLIVK